MSLKTHSDNEGATYASPPDPAHDGERDTIPRIKIRDVISSVLFLQRNRAATLDGLRVKLNSDRGESSRDTRGYSVARDVASELRALGFAEISAVPKDSKAFEKKRDAPINLTDSGMELAECVRADRAAAYEAVLKTFHRTHAYARRYVAALRRAPFLAPVLTSWEQHISPRYASAQALADDVARGEFDIASLLQVTSTRLAREIGAAERGEIERAIDALLERLRTAAAQEQQTEFARKMLMAVNEIVVPAVLRREGLAFDYKTLSQLWSMGEEFQISWATSAHPLHKGRLTFATAEFDCSDDGREIQSVRFENGMKRIGEDFLNRLYQAYTLMQECGQPAVVTVWELRATFCFQNRCSPRVFDHLLMEHYGGSDLYRIDKDFPRNKPSHENALRVGGREIGLIRISKK
jgi:hypothetical protein